MTARGGREAEFRISYFKAPPVREVKPYLLRSDVEVVELVTGGVVRFVWENRELRLGLGALFWHMPGEETIHRTDPAAPYECLAIRFPGKRGGVRPAPRLSVISDRQRARELCRELLRAYHDEGIRRDILHNYARWRLIWEATLAGGRAVGGLPPSLDAALAFIESDFARSEAGVPEVARAAGLSEAHLHSLFRRHLSETPRQRLEARRAREAKWLLSTTSRAIKAIAADCGFQNLETFYRAFKRQVGVSPRVFRETHAGPVLAG